MGTTRRAHVFLSALAIGLTGCQCASGLTPLSPADVSVAPAALGFPATYVGSQSTLGLEVQNRGQQRAELEVVAPSPFFVAGSTLTVAGGSSASLEVRFAPGAEGHFEAVLKVGTHEIALSGDGLLVPECRAPDACSSAAFDPATAACVNAPLAEGAACETGCVVGGCRSGVCRGTAKGCDDQDVCTVDACSEADGCSHLPVECAPPANPCQESLCTGGAGCTVTDKPDGTLCGPDDCKSTQVDVCIAAQCVHRTRPELGRCTNRWVPAGLFARSAHAMAYDPIRRRVVLFGGYVDTHLGDTWEWDGTTWLERTPASSPPARAGHAMAYDAARRRVVLFGGATGTTPLDDTWEWDGVTWLERSPAARPPARQAHAMAYDSVRQRVVLFGGNIDAAHRHSNDTWEWNGSTWAQLSPAVAPPGRVSHAMAFDAARRRTVLFGGEKAGTGAGTGSGSNDTWLWDGAAWVQAASAPTLASRRYHAMAYDAARQRIVVMGGDFAQGTWEFDGVAWAERAGTHFTPPLRRHAMAYDSSAQRTLAFGGGDDSGGLVDRTWAWDGTTWALRAQAAAPPARRGHAMAYDAARERTVVFGGYGSASYADTWEWDGARWAENTSQPAPPYRNGHRLAYDPALQRIVMLGGYAQGITRDDLWSLDGGQWAQQPATAPQPHSRAGHAATWDTARNRLVVFGGFETDAAGVSLPILGDTWEWDGAVWVQPLPAASPPPLERAAMAFDATRQRAVLFGGIDAANAASGKTWTWDGTTWLEHGVAGPPARSGHSLAWDPDRQRVVLFGGYSAANEPLSDTWEWDGAAWAQRRVAASPPGSGDFAMAYDAARQRMTAFGAGTWVLLP